MKEENILGKQNTEEVPSIVYEKMIIEVVGRIKNKKLLKRIYALAEYLYLHEDSE